MQQLFEKVPEFCVENCVDDGVESAVDVAEPRYHAHQRRWDMTVLTAGPQGVKDKEGSPAEQEGTCGNRRGGRSDRLKSSTFLFARFCVNRDASASSVVSSALKVAR